MIFCGIDPGLNGGLAFIDRRHELNPSLYKPLYLFSMPTIAGKDYDLQTIKRLLKLEFMPEGMPKTGLLITTEQQIALPGQGLSSTFQTGKGFGIILGLCAGMQIPHQVCSAKMWQSKMFTGVKVNFDTKVKSEIIAKRLFPTADFRRSERATKAHDGLTDATCIAEFAKRTFGDNTTQFDNP